MIMILYNTWGVVGQMDMPDVKPPRHRGRGFCLWQCFAPGQGSMFI